MRAPIFISGIHKSGTTLLRSLLDDHPQLFVIPFETHYFQNFGQWVRNPYRKQNPVKLHVDEIINAFTKWIEHYNTTDNVLADSAIAGSIDPDIFKKSFSDQDESTSHKDRIELYFRSVARALGKPSDDQDKEFRFVEKSIENAEFSFAYQNLFPDAKFLHIIRNPYANIVSLRKFRMSGNKPYPLMHRMIETIRSNFYHLYQNSSFIRNFKLVKYEELVSEPEKIMRAVAEFLEIDYCESLLKPTVLGSDWHGNSTTGNKFKTVSADGLNKWQSEIKHPEVYYINRAVPFVFDDFGYTKIDDNAGFWLAIKEEPFRKYLANRLYRYYL